MERPGTQPRFWWLLSVILAMGTEGTVGHASCNASVPIRQLSSSSAYQEAVAARQARLDNEAGGGAWCPKGLVGEASDNQEFLQLDLGEADHVAEEEEEFVLNGLVVQGRWANGLGQEFAEQVMLQFWRPDLQSFVTYATARGSTVLEANRDTHSKVVINLTERRVVAAKVRIIPVSRHPRTVCLRVGLLGCPARTLDLKRTESASENTLIPSYEVWEDAGGYLGVAIGVLITVVLLLIIIIFFILYKNLLARSQMDRDPKQIFWEYEVENAAYGILQSCPPSTTLAANRTFTRTGGRQLPYGDHHAYAAVQPCGMTKQYPSDLDEAGIYTPLHFDQRRKVNSTAVRNSCQAAFGSLAAPHAAYSNATAVSNQYGFLVKQYSQPATAGQNIYQPAEGKLYCAPAARVSRKYRNPAAPLFDSPAVQSSCQAAISSCPAGEEWSQRHPSRSPPTTSEEIYTDSSGDCTAPLLRQPAIIVPRRQQDGLTAFIRVA